MRRIAIALAIATAGCYRSHQQEAAPPLSDCTGNPATAAVVDMIESVSAPSGGFYEVALEGGGTYLFDASDPSSEIYVDIVESRMSRGEPIYLEYERDTRLIVDVGMPMEFLVLTIEETAEGAHMTFEVSAAIHGMSSALTCYDLFLETLRTALANGTTVWVTHNSLYEIIDVRTGW